MQGPLVPIPDSTKNVVFLLHGLLMPAAVMTPLERRLRRNGFATRNLGYPSRTTPWRRSVEILRREVEACSAERIHFIGHSMGGLVVTSLLNEFPQTVPGRVVTVATPHEGSVVARNMSKRSPGRWVMGGAKSLLASGLRPNWNSERSLHLIAGTSGIGLPRLLFGNGLEIPNDGVVSVEECTLKGAESLDTFPCNHTMLLFDKATTARVVELLAQ